METGAPDMIARIAMPSDKIAAFCERWQVTELALFGSVLRKDFGPKSDVDVLVRFEQAAKHSFFDLDEMELELKGIFGREVELTSRRGLENSPNYLRRNAILESARVIYGS